jgi:hypothetical protein
MAAPIPKLPAAFAIGISLIGCYLLAWLAASFGLLGEAHLGYYGDFYFVKHALQKTGCVDSMEYSRHEDLTLEDFHFKVRTKSGRLVRVWFDYSQDVSLVCRAPRGLLIVHPRNSLALDQNYNIETILEHLNARGIKTADLQSILCNIDELAPLFEANYDADSIPRVGWEPERTKRFSDYLRLEVVDEAIDQGLIEIPIATNMSVGPHSHIEGELQ